jgi:hypothetical protein
VHHRKLVYKQKKNITMLGQEVAVEVSASDTSYDRCCRRRNRDGATRRRFTLVQFAQYDTGMILLVFLH